MANLNQQLSLASKNYSDALVKLAQDNLMSFDELDTELNKISEILNMSEQLRLTLENPVISNEIKFEIADSVFAKDINPHLINFIKILLEKKRFNEFNLIKAGYEKRIEALNNIQAVEITSAVELKNEYKEKVIQKLSEKLNKTIRPVWKIDESVIAGLIFKIEDDVIDTTIKNKLDKLSKSLL